MSFLDFCTSSNWERESGKRNLGIKEKCPQSYLSFFLTGFHWRIFFFHGLIDFVLFLVLAWGTRVSHVSVNLLSSTRSKMAMVRLPAMNPAQKLNSSYLLPLRGREPHFRFGVPANHFGFSLFPLPMSGSLRSLSTNICLSPLWPTFSLNGHFLTAKKCWFNPGGQYQSYLFVSVSYHVTGGRVRNC